MVGARERKEGTRDAEYILNGWFTFYVSAKCNVRTVALLPLPSHHHHRHHRHLSPNPFEIHHQTSLFWKWGRWVFSHTPICSRAKRLLLFILSFTLISLFLGFLHLGLSFLVFGLDVGIGIGTELGPAGREPFRFLSFFFFFPLLLLSNGEFIWQCSWAYFGPLFKHFYWF